jgi:hypothetical protein
MTSAYLIKPWDDFTFCLKTADNRNAVPMQQLLQQICETEQYLFGRVLL